MITDWESWYNQDVHTMQSNLHIQHVLHQAQQYWGTVYWERGVGKEEWWWVKLSSNSTYSFQYGKPGDSLFLQDQRPWSLLTPRFNYQQWHSNQLSINVQSYEKQDLVMKKNKSRNNKEFQSLQEHIFEHRYNWLCEN